MSAQGQCSVRCEAMVQIRYIFGPKEAGPSRLPVLATEAVLANTKQQRRTRTR